MEAVRNVNSEGWLFHHHGKEVLDGQLVVHWDIYCLNLVHSEETLPFAENIFEEILVETGVGREIELH